MINIVFYFLATVMLISAFLVVYLRNPIYNLLSLLVCFFSLSGLFILLNAEMLALFVLLIYSVGLAVIFVFVLMTVKLDKIPYKKLCRCSMFSFIFVFIELALVYYLKIGTGSKILFKNIEFSPSDVISLNLSHSVFGTYSYVIMALAFIMLVGMVGSVVLLFNKPEEFDEQQKNMEDPKVELKAVKSNEGVEIC